MKYKVGDEVKIKSWIELQKEFGVSESGDIYRIPCFSFGTNALLDNMSPNRTATITKIVNDKVDDTGEGYSYYETEECGNWAIAEYAIKGLVKPQKPEDLEPIKNRFDILDIKEEE